jgi:hypothetical protein
MTDQLSRRDFLGVAAGAAAAALTNTSPARAQGRPNVLFILADDMGYGDLSCYGRPDYETPVLDRLAEQGMKFTSNYAAAPVCTPTRCAFITGQYPQRFAVGLEEPLTAESPLVGLPAAQPTIATRMRGAGYETALIGKWHLGWKPEFRPNQHGFDDFYGSLSGALDYFTHIAPDSGETTLLDLWENDRRVTTDGYLTDVFSDRAAEYVARARSKPFYLSLHYTAPHAPWEGPADGSTTDHTDHGKGPMVNGGALADEHFMPDAITWRNRRFGTPHFAILIATFVPMFVLVSTRGNLLLLGELYAFGLLGAFVLSSLGLDVVRWREGDRSLRFWFGVLTTLLVVVAWFTTLFVNQTATIAGGLRTARCRSGR